MSQLKIKDGNSWVNIPSSGMGVPSGGSSGDVLTKSSSTDYATQWTDANNVIPLEHETVSFTFTNLATATLNFYKYGAIVFVDATVSVLSNATAQPYTVIASSGTIPVGFRPANDVGTFCSRTDVGSTWEAEQGMGLQSASCLRFYPNGNLGLGMINKLLTGVDILGTLVYAAGS